jgi:hypothetical protein
MLPVTVANEMNLSHAHKLLLADPSSAVRISFRKWWKALRPKEAKEKPRKLVRDRHLTCAQRENISTGLRDSVTGPVSMTATASDREAVSYEGEIASVLEDTGFKVEIDNQTEKSPGEKMSPGVEMTIADKTIRPRHAFRIVHAFRRAGVAIATRINARRQRRNTLYITVGPNGTPPIQTGADVEIEADIDPAREMENQIRAWPTAP